MSPTVIFFLFLGLLDVIVFLVVYFILERRRKNGDYGDVAGQLIKSTFP